MRESEAPSVSAGAAFSGPDAAAGAYASETAIRPCREAKEEFDRQYLEHLLRLARGNIAQAARLAGKYRTEVYGMIRKYQVDPREFK